MVTIVDISNLRNAFQTLYVLWLLSPGAVLGLITWLGGGHWHWLLAGVGAWVVWGLLLLTTQTGEMLRFRLAAHTLATLGFVYAKVGVAANGAVVVLEVATFEQKDQKERES